MLSYTVWFFVDGKDGLKEVKVKAQDAAGAVAEALGYMPGVNVVVVQVVEGR